jgi:outer membrane protein OmpU
MARMGIIHNSDLPSNKTGFTSRARVTFTLTGETDGGLAFGASFRADNATGANDGTAGSVFISGDFGRLSMGDVDGAAEARNGDLHAVGLTAGAGLFTTNEFTYLSNASTGVRPTARYDYSIDGFSFSLSHTNPSTASKVASVGVGYSMAGFTVGLGAERQNSVAAVNETLTHVVVSAGYSMDGISVKAMYGRLKESGQTLPLDFAAKDQYGLSASGTFDAITVSAFGRRDFDKDTHIGIGASYDLGGGAALRGGVINTNFNAAGRKSRTVADMGVAFTF